MGCPESLCVLHLCRFSRSNWVKDLILKLSLVWVGSWTQGMLRSLHSELSSDPTNLAWWGQPERDRTTFSSHQDILFLGSSTTPRLPTPPAPSVSQCLPLLPYCNLLHQTQGPSRMCFQSLNSNFTGSSWMVRRTQVSFQLLWLKDLEYYPHGITSHSDHKVRHSEKTMMAKPQRGNTSQEICSWRGQGLAWAWQRAERQLPSGCCACPASTAHLGCPSPKSLHRRYQGQGHRSAYAGIYREPGGGSIFCPA